SGKQQLGRARAKGGARLDFDCHEVEQIPIEQLSPTWRPPGKAAAINGYLPFPRRGTRASSAACWADVDLRFSRLIGVIRDPSTVWRDTCVSLIELGLYEGA